MTTFRYHEKGRASDAVANLDHATYRLLVWYYGFQGTGAVVLSGFINGLRLQKTQPADARIVFVGAGSSACGVAEMIATYLEGASGVSREAARAQIYMIDSHGLVRSPIQMVAW